jgi:DNA mismatch endonuclease (patch repair protein)
MGYRFSLHRRDLPRRPDIWHLHPNCKDARIPKTKRTWWQEKLEGNASRDKCHAAALRRIGWRVIRIWECQTDKQEPLKKRLGRLLGHQPT